MNFLKRDILLAGLLALIITAQAHAGTPLNIHVSILPQKYFVERIAREKARVDVLVRPGKSPATYSPSPDQIRRLARSDIYFRIGVPFENGILNKIEQIAPNVRVVDTRKNIRLRQMKAGIGHGHKKIMPEPGLLDAHDAVHEEGMDLGQGKDPHIWLSPVLVKIQAKTIFKALVQKDPGSRTDYEKNYTGFIQDLDHLNQQLTAILAPFKGENVFVFHPSFGYFTDQYGLNQVAVETMGRAPRGKELSKIIKMARKQKVRVIFVQPQFDGAAAQKIAEAINGAVVAVNPLAQDYPANMKKMAQAIARGLNRPG